jgi:murein DD-endopeptidase MepM/ murein hydrolase activator NlpD
VRVGQQIAAVGDSGHSLWPHLHFHVQDRPELDAQARTVPVVSRDGPAHQERPTLHTGPRRLEAR